jgi:hypothetical protein
MEQRDSICAPNLAALEDEARRLTQHPAFDRALTLFCDGLINFHVGRRLANVGMGHTLGWATAVLIVYLDHALPEGVTSAHLARLLTAGGLAGPKAVKGAINVLLSFGLIEQETHGADRRAKRLRPTALLLDVQRDNVVARLSALEIVQPLPRPAREWGRESRVVIAFLGGNVRAFAHHKFRLYDSFPEIRAFMDRACGYLVLLDLLRRADDASGGAIVTAASPSALASRFDISRAHVRKLLAAAQAQRWLDVDASVGCVFLDASFHRRLILWIALEFVWMWRLVRPDRSSSGRD